MREEEPERRVNRNGFLKPEGECIMYQAIIVDDEPRTRTALLRRKMNC